MDQGPVALLAGQVGCDQARMVEVVFDLADRSVVEAPDLYAVAEVEHLGRQASAGLLEALRQLEESSTSPPKFVAPKHLLEYLEYLG